MCFSRFGRKSGSHFGLLETHFRCLLSPCLVCIGSFGVFGSFRKASRGSKRRENHTFSRVFRVFSFIQILMFSFRFFAHVTKTTRFRAFFGPRGYGSVLVSKLFAHRFRPLALRTCAQNHAFYCVSVIAPSFLCFSCTLLLAFFAFFEM